MEIILLAAGLCILFAAFLIAKTAFKKFKGKKIYAIAIAAGVFIFSFCVISFAVGFLFSIAFPFER